MTELLTPTVNEVAALMCRVADENPWKRGKRSFMVTSRDIFGLNLMVRQKHEMMAISTSSWRVAITLIHGMGSARQMMSDNSTVIVKLPFKGPDAREIKRQLIRYNRHGRTQQPFQEPPLTTIAERLVAKEMVFDVTDKDRFEHEWTLLRLFSTEWAQYAA